MENIFNDITSPSWWIGVVIVGIIINIISAYLKPNLDKILSNTSSRWKNIIESRRSKRILLIEGLKNDFYNQAFLALIEIRYRFTLLLYLIIGIAFLIISVFMLFMLPTTKIPIIFCLIGFMICILISLEIFRRSNSIFSILSDARSQKDAR
jgi:hypothetical protein